MHYVLDTLHKLKLGQSATLPAKDVHSVQDFKERYVEPTLSNVTRKILNEAPEYKYRFSIKETERWCNKNGFRVVEDMRSRYIIFLKEEASF